jgi:hypothetical protein
MLLVHHIGTSARKRQQKNQPKHQPKHQPMHQPSIPSQKAVRIVMNASLMTGGLQTTRAGAGNVPTTKGIVHMMGLFMTTKI